MKLEKAICSEKFSRHNTTTRTACKPYYYSHTHVFYPPPMNCANSFVVILELGFRYI